MRQVGWALRDQAVEYRDVGQECIEALADVSGHLLHNRQVALGYGAKVQRLDVFGVLVRKTVANLASLFQSRERFGIIS